jgi:hypothetical protein
MNDIKHLLLNQKETEYQENKTHVWLGIQNEIQRRKKRTRVVISFISLAILSFSFANQSNYEGQLYSDKQFAKIIELEAQLENELSSLEIKSIPTDERLLELHERLALLNQRIDQVKLEINMNPLNPNYHQLYLTMLKTKHRIIETLNQKG